MAIQQQAFKGEIELSFLYISQPGATPVKYDIEPERIKYVMIEKLYENVNILPVIYLSLNVKTSIYQKMIDSYETSILYLRIRKQNVMSKTSILTEVVNDTFSYVSSSTSTDYARDLTSKATENDAFRGIILGAVSIEMTEQLRIPFNDVFYNVDQEKLIKYGLRGLNNIIQEPITYNKSFNQLLIPPLPSRYKFFKFLFDRKAFYDSYFTFFMDFKNTYLISKNGYAVKAKDGKPSNVIINIKDYTANDAYTDGFTITNNTYYININAMDTNPVINDAVNKVASNIVSYSDNNGVQNLSIDDSSNLITTYIRSDNAAALKNEILNTKYMIELNKQNIDSDIFTPNKQFMINNYGELSRYNGRYILSYKREFYYFTQGNKFTITCNIGLKLTQEEETAMSKTDHVIPKIATKGQKKKKTSTKKPNSTTTANRKASTKKSLSSNANSARKQK